jgi:hypothetical protein
VAVLEAEVVELKRQMAWRIDNWTRCLDAERERTKAALRRVDDLETRVALAESKLQGADSIIESQHAAVERYEFMRCMRPDEFTDLWRRCLKNEGRFDDLVDDGMRKLKGHKSGGEGVK